jgi:hypothetical protein
MQIGAGTSVPLSARLGGASGGGSLALLLVLDHALELLQAVAQVAPDGWGGDVLREPA